IFDEEGYLHPEGFTKSDVHLNAPRLFSDMLYLEYCMQTCEMELMFYNLGFIEAVKPNIQRYFTEVLTDSQNLEIKSKKLSKEKGLYIRAPHIPKQKKVDYVEKDSFLAGWFGEKRPLLGIEIAQLVFHAKRNALGQAVITGFSQVAKSKEVRRFFERGREIAGKQFDVFSSILSDEYLPNAASLMTSEVTDSTEAPFSDKLMLRFITALIRAGMSGDGSAISQSARPDLGGVYSRLIAEIAGYSDDAAEILIKHGWL